MKRVSIVLFLVGALDCVPGSGNALDSLSLQVSPGIAMAPANVRVLARVYRDVDNRALEVAAESDEFYRSSYISLEGDKAPTVTEISFKGLPGGQYRVSVVLHGSRGVRGRASREVNIIPSASER